jgi:sugar fermentation stimulation protein A
MQFPAPLVRGHLLRRYQRFLAEVELAEGECVLAHCPNTGAMPGLTAPGLPVWLSAASNPKRRCRFTWELVELEGEMVGVHTGRANALVAEAIRVGQLPELAGYSQVRAEVRAAGSHSRFDFHLSGHARDADCWLEVKNVTALVENGIGLFPDAVTARGTRHVQALQQLVAEGSRCALVFCIQRGDVDELRPADAIDPAYGAALRSALAAGVELYALAAEVSPGAIQLVRRVPVICR